MKARFILLISFLFFSLSNYAQYMNVWAFGRNAGIDFNTNPPTAIKTALSTSEGSASICDANGNLLFYTDGDKVWDRNHQVMPNGNDLPGVGENITASTSQGALIVPMPESNDKYYLFSLGQLEATVENSPYLGKLYYSIIDMRLNNGLGDVDVNAKGILLDTFLMEQIVAVSGNNCNVWLIAPSRDTLFKSYIIDGNGINANPVLSFRIAEERQSNPRGYLGNIDVTSDRNRLILSKGNLILYDFDAETGQVSNPLVLDKEIAANYYGAAFSEDNTKLYTTNGRGVLKQFDLSAGDVIAIVGSETVIGYSSHALRRGPDGKIYTVTGTGNSIGVVHQPNLKGLACAFEPNSFTLSAGTGAQLGLPNFTTIATTRKVRRMQTDTAFCVSSFLLRAKNPSGRNYVWDDGSTNPSRRVTTAGTYWVSYEVASPCMFDECVDTFKVRFDHSTKDIYTSTRDSGLCKTDTVLMQASNPNGSNYIWEDGSRGSQRKINRTGTYWLKYQVDGSCGNHIDSFIISYPEKDYRVAFNADSFICESDTIRFENISDPHYNRFLWSFDQNAFSALKNPEHIYATPGSYTVMLSGLMDSICPDTAYQTIEVDPRLSVSFDHYPDSICVGESISISHQIAGPTVRRLTWDFGEGSEADIWHDAFRHAYDQSGIMPVTLKSQFRACPASSFTDTVQVFDLPKVDLGQDVAICKNGPPVILKNLADNAPGTYRFFWNTGAETSVLAIEEPGIYSLRLSAAPLGCSSTESVAVKADCYIDIPNAFSPDGDGSNDYFFPRQLLSKSLTRFRMQVLNRWGQVIYETTNTDGRGWDGRFNDKDQPQGVYVYLIEVEIAGEGERRFQGNVTLLR